MAVFRINLTAVLFILFLPANLLYITTGECAEQETDATVAAATIVEKADLIRFPAEGFQVDISITTTSPESDTDIHQYRILSKGTENTIVQTTAPPSERGQIMLMRGNNLWVFMPNVSQPIRLPLSQRLTGQVANGDLARANFRGDYDAKILRVDKIDEQPHYVLELIAANRRVTYHRVIYWVNKDTFRPQKAEFYTLSGRLLKKARYENFKRLGGEIRPTRLVLVDTLREGEQSTLKYTNMKMRKLPDKVFTKDYLKKLH